MCQFTEIERHRRLTFFAVVSPSSQGTNGKKPGIETDEKGNKKGVTADKTSWYAKAGDPLGYEIALAPRVTLACENEGAT